MRTLASLFLLLMLCPALLTCNAAAAIGEGTPSKLLLQDNWNIQASTEVRAGGEAISTAGFNAGDWYRAKVPSTVLAALVQDEVYPDPYFGMNLRSIPGASYPIGTEAFMLTPMPPESPFRFSWCVASNPGKKFVHYTKGGHGADMFAVHSELRSVIVDWCVTTLVTTPGRAPADKSSEPASQSAQILK